jgi:hypothetical protein
MNFLAPWAAWFAATIPVVVIFYLLKRRRVVLRVPSTVLWQKYLAETQASAPFQKLRKNWLLFMQILLLALAVFGLARPFFAGQQTPSSLRVLILDASASMQSTDVAPSRFEAARSEALRWVDGLKPGQSMVVLQAGPRTEVRQSATSDRQALRRALQAAAVTDGPARAGEALKMAESLIRDVADAEIHLFSDGAISGLEAFENHNLPLVFHRVGERLNNVAITSLDVRANPENANQRAVFTSVANLTSAALETTVELRFAGDLLDVRPVTIAAGETESLVFVVSQQADGVFTVRHTAADDLPVDNQSSVVSLLPRPVKVLLVSRGNRFLEKAIRSVGAVDLSVAAEAPVDTMGWDIVVLDDVSPAVWPKGNVLAVRVAEPGWFESSEVVRAPPVVDWKSAHPLLRYVNLDNVQVAEASGIKAPRWGTVLVEAPQTPLVVAGEVGRQRVIWIGFDLLASNWPLRVSFPMFIANAMEWLNPATTTAERLNVRAGEPIRIEVPEGTTAAEVQPPGEGWRPISIDAGSTELVFGGTDRQGGYGVRWGTNVTSVVVRALDLLESDSTPRKEIQMGRYGGAVATTMRSANLEIWRWFAGIALAVLLFEWWFYHRRTA